MSVLGFASGQIVQELGLPDEALGEQAIADIRAAVAEETQTDLVDEDYDEVCDGAMLWWTAEDGEVEDLNYALVDALSLLKEDGQVLLLVPGRGQKNTVDHADIADAAEDAGLHPTKSLALGPWTAVRLIPRGGRR